MNILVTGGTGFLGKHVINLLSKNHQLFIITRKKSDAKNNFIYINADLRNINDLKNKTKNLPKINTIIHLAANVPRLAAQDNPQILIDNFLMTQNLLFSFPNIKRFIFASSIESYGVQKNKNISEKTKQSPQTHYGIGKVIEENIVERFCKTNNIQYLILRFSIMYGNNDEIDRAIPNFIKLALNGEKIIVTNGNSTRDYLYVADAAHAVIQAILSKHSGIYCIGTAKATKIIDAAHAIKNAINPQLKIIEKNNSVNHLVYNVSKTEKELKFKSRYNFPDKLDAVINSYKSTKVFIDLDGTLLNIWQRHYAVYKHVVQLLQGGIINFEIYKQLKQEDNSLEIYKKSKIENKIKQYNKLFLKNIEKKKYLKLDTVNQDVKKTLNKIAENKTEIYLLTLRQSKTNTLWQLKQLKLLKYFNGKFLISENERSKINLLENYKTSSNDFIIGDTKEDILTGKFYRMQTIAILNGLRSKKHLKSLQPTFILNNFSEIYSCLNSTN